MNENRLTVLVVDDTPANIHIEEIMTLPAPGEGPQLAPPEALPPPSQSPANG